MWRCLPRAGWLIPERSSSSGVPKAPPGLITALALTCQSRPGGGGPLRDLPWAAAPGRGGAVAGPPGGGGGRQPRPALEADGTAILGDHALPLDTGADARPGRDRERQIGDVGRPLRVDLATQRAGAALD